MVLERLRNDRIVPVIVMEDDGHAEQLADTLGEAGLSCAEVTLRTDAALRSLEIMAKRGDLVVGAGTVLSVEQAKDAVEAGAAFIVSPGFSRRLVDWCFERNILVIPGCATPSEILLALEAGIDTVKFFPAELLGGVKMLRTLGGVFGSVKFMPTGGIGLDNLRDYLEMDAVVACGGSWMVKSEWLRSGKFERIKAESRQAVAFAKSIQVRRG